MINPPAMFGTDVGADDRVENPLDLLDAWLAPVADRDDSVGSEVGGAPGAADSSSVPLMALATLDAEGYPRVRHVLLSAYDRGRLHFHTDERSAKAAQLLANPRAGATIVWPANARQLSVSGNVERESPEEEAHAYAHRSRDLQLLAWINEQGLTGLGEAERARMWAAFAAEHPTLAPPPAWAGYVLVPEIISFWRGASGGPSQRVAYRRTYDGWVAERLPG